MEDDRQGLGRGRRRISCHRSFQGQGWIWRRRLPRRPKSVQPVETNEVCRSARGSRFIGFDKGPGLSRCSVKTGAERQGLSIHCLRAHARATVRTAVGCPRQSFLLRQYRLLASCGDPPGAGRARSFRGAAAGELFPDRSSRWYGPAGALSLVSRMARELTRVSTGELLLLSSYTAPPAPGG